MLLRFDFRKNLANWISMVLAMLFKIAHVKIFLFASFEFTVEDPPILFPVDMDLLMLFQIGSGREFLAALAAYKSFVIFVNFLVPVEIGFLYKQRQIPC